MPKPTGKQYRNSKNVSRNSKKRSRKSGQKKTEKLSKKQKLLISAGIFIGLLSIWLVAEYASLPQVDNLVNEWPQSTAFIRKREAELKGQGKSIDYQPVPLSKISKHLRNAVLNIEDSRFYQHDGFDYVEIGNAVAKNIQSGKIVRGASTITQQLAKNLYLTPSRNPIRKYKEIIITKRLEKELSKDRIFEIYLNVVEWGETVYGIEAASEYYFGINASGLNPGQAVLLAVMLPNPRYYNPYTNMEKILPKWKLHLSRLCDYGYITGKEYKKALEEGITLCSRDSNKSK
jgi:monofunctional biosynthetic peptidoglycan transglycosylase